MKKLHIYLCKLQSHRSGDMVFINYYLLFDGWIFTVESLECFSCTIHFSISISIRLPHLSVNYLLLESKLMNCKQNDKQRSIDP